MQCSINHVNKCGLYLTISGEPLNDYKQGSDMVEFILRKVTLLVGYKNGLEKHKNIGRQTHQEAMAEIQIRDDGSLLYSSNCIYPLTCLFFPLNYKLECLKFIVEKWTHLHDVLKVELIRLVDI